MSTFVMRKVNVAPGKKTAFTCLTGSTENAGPENEGLKKQGRNMQDQ